MVRDKDTHKEIWYQTVGHALWNTQAYRLMGRAIRVWKVRKLGPDDEPCGNEMVLKDFWIPEDSKTEGQIQAEIFECVRKELSGESEPEGFKKYFMTIVHDTVVKLDKRLDTSRLFLRGTFNASQCSQRPLFLPLVHTEQCDMPKPTSFKDIKHCRLVFKKWERRCTESRI